MLVGLLFGQLVIVCFCLIKWVSTWEKSHSTAPVWCRSSQWGHFSSDESILNRSLLLPLIQFSTLHAVADKPEGNIHFAGEHLSRRHSEFSFHLFASALPPFLLFGAHRRCFSKSAWISGALESSRDAVRKMTNDPTLPALGQSRSVPKDSTSQGKAESRRAGSSVSRNQLQMMARARLWGNDSTLSSGRPLFLPLAFIGFWWRLLYLWWTVTSIRNRTQ